MSPFCHCLNWGRCYPEGDNGLRLWLIGVLAIDRCQPFYLCGILSAEVIWRYTSNNLNNDKAIKRSHQGVKTFTGNDYTLMALRKMCSATVKSWLTQLKWQDCCPIFYWCCCCILLQIDLVLVIRNDLSLNNIWQTNIRLINLFTY